MMDIFGFRSEIVQPIEAALGTLRNFVEGAEGLANFHFRENPHTLQSLGPGAVHGKFVGQKAAVERKRALKRVEPFVRRAIETATPEAIVFAFGHRNPKPRVSRNTPKKSLKFFPPLSRGNVHHNL